MGILRGGLFYTRIGPTTGDTRNTGSSWRPMSWAIQWMHPTLGQRLFLTRYDTTHFDIVEYDPGTDTWTVALNAVAGSSDSAWGGFLPVTGTDGQPYLVSQVQTTTGGLGWARYDGTSWVLDSIGFGVTVSRDSFAFQGLIHTRLRRNTGGAEAYTYDPVTRTIASALVPAFGGPNSVKVFFVLEGRLFRFEPGTSASGASIWEWTLGTWVANATRPLIWGANNTRAGIAVFRISDSKCLMIAPGNSGGQNLTADGMYAALITIVGGVLTFTDVTDPVVPPFLRGGTTVGTPEN
jgi:hypothetical protein